MDVSFKSHARSAGGIEAIADAGQDEERKRGAVTAVQHGGDQEGNDAEPQERQLVGRGAKVFLCKAPWR